MPIIPCKCNLQITVNVFSFLEEFVLLVSDFFPLALLHIIIALRSLESVRGQQSPVKP